MTTFTHSEEKNQVRSAVQNSPWLVACLCAAWCDTCNAYRTGFDDVALRHPNKCFDWIDIEDCADLIDALDIENFPTLLIQYQEQTVFYGTMLPEASLLQRLLLSLEEQVLSGRVNSAQTPANFNLRNLILAESNQ